MKNTSKTTGVILWLLAFCLTIGIASYQRLTGPTHPIDNDFEAFGGEVSYNLLRSYTTGSDAPVVIKVPNTDVDGYLRYRRYNSHDDWTEVKMIHMEGELRASLPKQPAAGKIMYNITLIKDKKKIVLEDSPVILRYKGHVPAYVLIPHILFMFLALLFAIRVGLEALFNRGRSYRYTVVTLICLVAGGLILGPIVQKYAFDAYWTGWPWGTDLTDNKTAVGVIFWVIAYWKLRKNPNNRLWPILALIVFLAVYLIPHSAFGSELDHTTQG